MTIIEDAFVKARLETFVKQEARHVQAFGALESVHKEQYDKED